MSQEPGMQGTQQLESKKEDAWFLLTGPSQHDSRSEGSKDAEGED